MQETVERQEDSSKVVTQENTNTNKTVPTWGSLAERYEKTRDQREESGDLAFNSAVLATFWALSYFGIATSSIGVSPASILLLLTVPAFVPYFLSGLFIDLPDFDATYFGTFTGIFCASVIAPTVSGFALTSESVAQIGVSSPLLSLISVLLFLVSGVVGFVAGPTLAVAFSRAGRKLKSSCDTVGEFI